MLVLIAHISVQIVIRPAAELQERMLGLEGADERGHNAIPGWSF